MSPSTTPAAGSVRATKVRSACARYPMWAAVAIAAHPRRPNASCPSPHTPRTSIRRRASATNGYLTGPGHRRRPSSAGFVRKGVGPNAITIAGFLAGHGLMRADPGRAVGARVARVHGWLAQRHVGRVRRPAVRQSVDVRRIPRLHARPLGRRHRAGIHRHRVCTPRYHWRPRGVLRRVDRFVSGVVHTRTGRGSGHRLEQAAA